MILQATRTFRLGATSLVLVALSLPQSIVGQTGGGLSGRVLHKLTGEGVSGVRVSLAETPATDVTDSEGRFRLSDLNAGEHELRFHLLGCMLATSAVRVEEGEETAKEFAVGSLTLAVPGLVVHGLSRDLPDSDLPFALGRVEPNDPKAPRSLADLIRGRVPGVRIVQGSGEPGSAPSVQLRGPTSIQGAQDALVVVDGVTAGTRLVDIDPSDVQSVQVLMGAVAAASYGSRGQAGVLEITTKRGVGRTPAPVLIVDGDIVETTLSALPPESIAHVEILRAYDAQLILGDRARGGVIHVTTVDAPRSVAAAVPAYCSGP